MQNLETVNRHIPTTRPTKSEGCAACKKIAFLEYIQKKKVNIYFESLGKPRDNEECALCRKPAAFEYVVEGNKNVYRLCEDKQCFAHFELNDRFIIHIIAKKPRMPKKESEGMTKCASI